MNRKQLKSIQNIAAKATSRQAAKQFNTREEFKAVPGAFIHIPTATLFVK